MLKIITFSLLLTILFWIEIEGKFYYSDFIRNLSIFDFQLGIPNGKPPLECTRPNEEYQCGSACQIECDTLSEPCLIANVKCTEACYCTKGYARISPGGMCIPINECPSK